MASARIALPLAGIPLLILVAVWLLPGLVGHDPWKNDDAIGIGIAHQFASHGDWLLPRLAGEHYAEDGPLFYWIAAAFAKLLGWLIAPHDAARLAGGACIGLTLVFLRLAGRGFDHNDKHDDDKRGNDSRGRGDSVMLLFMGCTGLLLHAHETISDTALLAGLACAYYGAALIDKRPYAAGIALGCGLGAAFLATGLAPILPLLVALLATPLFVPDWRSRNAGLVLVCALAALLPWLVPWPALLYARSPELFAAWLYQANLAALVQGPSLPAAAHTLQTLAWFAWPAWPIALWALWLYRRKPVSAGVVLPLAALIAGLGLAWCARAPGELPLLPLLLPLALLGAPVLDDLRRGAANSLAWFGAITFSLLGGLIWLGYCALQTGFPPRIAANAARLEPGFVSHFAWLPFIAAIALTFAWIALIFRSRRSPQRSVTFWAAGLALFWALVMLLWLPWIDYGKSYRELARSLQASLPKHAGCIASHGLGEAQRAAFDYHASIVTERSGNRAQRDCRLLLVQSNARLPEASPGAPWKKIWEGNRVGDRTEKFRLYAKQKETP
ncbi:MAG: glycosyltransferase family 39 protein [Betaproteobacteria bacterium]|nr:glycosyltransferase family 39 protein [Betaproteobacteria bacterium]